MKQQQTHKHSKLHQDDQHITVEELWRAWKTSEGKHKSTASAPEVTNQVRLFSSGGGGGGRGGGGQVH